MKKIDNFLKVLLYYHVERCEYEDCHQCLFAINLCYAFVENTVQQNNSVIPLQQFCLLKIDQFKCCKTLINTLVQLEKQRLLIENIRIMEQTRSNPLKTTGASSSSS